MPTPTIPAGNLFMDATLYTGNGGTQSVINGVAGQEFQPDFVWLKSRSNALNHNIFDSVRGVQNVLASNSTGGNNYAGTGELTAFNSNGFTLVNSGTYQTNQSGYTYVAWNFKAGGTAVSNTTGTISSSVSANQTSGFSVVTYTGTGSNGSVGHGLSVLGVAPQMIFIKKRNTTGNWIVYHVSRGASYYCALNLTGNYGPNSTIFNDTAPTGTVFTIGTDSDVNASGSTYVAYCWAPIAGYSTFGTYTGSGNSGASSPNANGPFVYTGFRPRFVLIKRTSAAADWEIFDSSRGTYNANQPWLQPNTSSAESSAEAVDFLSNGFKIRSESGALMYPDGATFIYAAFAENPFKYANAR